MGSCSCDDGEFIEVLKSKTQKARKEYHCHECGKQINPGDPYHYLVGVCQHEILTYHTCPFCKNVFDDLINMGYCVFYGYLWETISELEKENI